MGDSLRERVQMVFEKGYMLNWITKVFTIVKVQRINPTRELSQKIAGVHELHRATHPDVYLVEKVLRQKEDKVYVKWLGFGWIAQFNEYTKTTSFDKILICVFFFYI